MRFIFIFIWLHEAGFERCHLGKEQRYLWQGGDEGLVSAFGVSQTDVLLWLSSILQKKMRDCLGIKLLFKGGHLQSGGKDKNLYF